MRLRASNPLTDNGLRVNCRRRLLVGHPAEHEAHPECRDQADRSSQRDPRFAEFGDVPSSSMRFSSALAVPTAGLWAADVSRVTASCSQPEFLTTPPRQ